MVRVVGSLFWHTGRFIKVRCMQTVWSTLLEVLSNSASQISAARSAGMERGWKTLSPPKLPHRPALPHATFITDPMKDKSSPLTCKWTCWTSCSLCWGLFYWMIFFFDGESVTLLDKHSCARTLATLTGFRHYIWMCVFRLIRALNFAFAKRNSRQFRLNMGLSWIWVYCTWEARQT